MRPVNLLPARYRPARASGERRGIGLAAIGVLAALLLMVLLYVVTNNGINDAKHKTAEAQAQEAVAQARVNQLQAYGDFATLKATRFNAVKSAAEQRFDYERLMREMALVLPHDTYLTTLSASSGGTTGTGPTVTAAGCAPDHPGVATTIVRLRKLHNVTDVALQSSTKATGTAATACKVSWTAQLTFQPESPATVEQPVPARLGGGQ